MRRWQLFVLAAAACGGALRPEPAPPADPTRLHVEIVASGTYRGALHAGAAAGLTALAFAIPVRAGGDVALQVEIAALEAGDERTRCTLKILILRLPHRDLLGIADGAAYAGGDAAHACIRALGEVLVRDKVRALLQRQHAAKQ